jgi:hypothetical protein
MLLYASRPSLIYGKPPKGSSSFPPFPRETLIILACWIGHFVKVRPFPPSLPLSLPSSP